MRSVVELNTHVQSHGIALTPLKVAQAALPNTILSYFLGFLIANKYFFTQQDNYYVKQ